MRQLRPDRFRGVEPSSAAKKFLGSAASGRSSSPYTITTTPLKETNLGVEPQSRRYVRGVLHTNPWPVRVGAIFALLLFVTAPLAIVASILIVLSGVYPESLNWVSNKLLILPLIVPALGFGYLIWGRGAKCRVCHQRLFVNKPSLKHPKAHGLPFLGYIIPKCIHLLLFSWFRCSSCGTPIRLKK